MAYVFVAGLMLGVGYQIALLHYFTPFKTKESPDLPEDSDDCFRFSLMIYNVLQTNTYTEALIEKLRKFQPDIFLTLETDQKWENALKNVESDYPYSIKVPLDNLYGMHFYSKFKLIEKEVRYVVEEGVPSIYATVQYGDEDCEMFKFVGVHPSPPAPGESMTSRAKDRELDILANHVKEYKCPTIVCGDFNDVPWSEAVRRFKAISTFEDPRVGRGFFNTFHKSYPFLRFPLDHLYHSGEIYFDHVQRIKIKGSDHMAMFYKLCLVQDEK